VTSSWFFLSTLNYDARSTTHQIDTNKIKDLDIADDLCEWSKPKNSNSRSRCVRTEDVPQVKLSNRFSVLEIDQQSIGFLKHMENKVKPLAGMTTFKKEDFITWK
jgi:hypothetical protein